ncbi:hypothetical protein H257_07288 [Aphanomyces astaci]|uniref:HAT C-terminal dimerisation domain-containing protein n=1 Tax=Aphanomyces astaci TaxID=112090 RepID=W4GIS9_APHAT|nr:hypothetical protein H257_07288 [Aphanomyces astaci]ETV79221.1 hypothetical protein H257_07288 [Aphanomyces astaci]|eukprot:XP_009831062.1 hypothetical protein H257_07288 [Aphanomyces astaci]
MLDIRNLFDECMLHPSASKRLASNSGVVGHANFEVAITKILDQSIATMSNGQVASVDRLKMAPKVLDASQDKPLTLAQRAKKRLKGSADADSYVGCRFIRPTSNMCERFFSWAKYALNDRRRATTPQNFEQQMFLKVNCSLWDVTDVDNTAISLPNKVHGPKANDNKALPLASSGAYTQWYVVSYNI